MAPEKQILWMNFFLLKFQLVLTLVSNGQNKNNILASFDILLPASDPSFVSV